MLLVIVWLRQELRIKMYRVIKNYQLSGDCDCFMYIDQRFYIEFIISFLFFCIIINKEFVIK